MPEPNTELEGHIDSFKGWLDNLLVVFLSLIPVYLYLELFADPGTPLAGYTYYLGYLLLGYFATEIGLSFLLYDSNRDFVRDRWTDILLTLPFLKGGKLLVSGLKLGTIGGTKIGLLLGKGTTAFQKGAKFLYKGRKVKQKRRTECDSTGNDAKDS